MNSPDGTNLPPPGWYPDPWQTAPERWWDGASWTGYSSTLGVQSARFVGGMNVPTRAGYRLNATVPVAVLTIDATSLTLHPRPFPIPMFSDFQVALSDVAVAFRLGGGPFTSGVGIELSDGQVAYFWTFTQQDRVLAALHHRGVPIDSASRRAVGALRGQWAWLWRWRASDPSVATLPGLSRLMMLIAPIGLLAGLAVAVVFASIGGSFGVIAVVLGALGVIHTARMWLASRK